MGHGRGHKVSLHNTVLEVLQAFPCVCEAHQSAKWEQEVGYYGDRSKVAMGIGCLVQQTFVGGWGNIMVDLSACCAHLIPPP